MKKVKFNKDTPLKVLRCKKINKNKRGVSNKVMSCYDHHSKYNNNKAKGVNHV